MTATTGLEPTAGLSLSTPPDSPESELSVSGLSDAGVAPARVLAILVAHDGQPWLDRALSALAAQEHSPSAVVAVDTGSTDGSRELLARARPDILREL
ncbi:MAG: glycosyltransferase family 2 protein, partial [Angustibacter sp.]